MKLFIAMPIHTTPQPHTMVCVSHMLVDLSRDHDVKFDPSLQVSNLAKERCVLLDEALRGDYDKLLFIDDDVLFKPEDVRRLLVEEGVVVAAPYPRKLENSPPVGYRLDQVGREPKRMGSLVGMACVGMGLTALDLHWFRHVSEPPTMFRVPGSEHPVAGWFEFKVAPDLGGDIRLLGEDEIFCKNVIERGGDVWLHGGMRVGHVGVKVY